MAITASSNGRIRILFRRFLRELFRLRNAVAVAMIFLAGSCATLRRHPHECDSVQRRFADVAYASHGWTWFSGAVVKRGYHAWGIASEELLAGTRDGEIVWQLRVRLAAECSAGANLWRRGDGSEFVRISGRGRFLPAENAVELDCLCQVEPTAYSDPKHHFAIY